MDKYVVILMCCLFFDKVSCIMWERVRCASDPDQNVPEGVAPDIGRFPWLGVVQHTFYIGGKTRFAITGGVLIHPAYAVAPAEDIARIQPETLGNNTKFIIWQSKSVKYSLDIIDYFLSPEYEGHVTLASLALLQLFTTGETGVSESVAPVLPICLPVRGAGTFDDLYAVKMTDESGELEKEVLKMNFVNDKECEEFYYKAKLSYKKMAPQFKICAASAVQNRSCVWDGGIALISRQSWGYWKLIGFGVRGPGCGAPARFINMHDHLLWIDEVITRLPYETREDTHAFIVRRLSPIKLVMYKADVKIPRELGQCDRKVRGSVLYKDNSEILVNKNFGQGFFFVSVAQAAQVNCLTVILDVSSRTNAAIWLEHHCMRDLTGTRTGRHRSDYKRVECFVYFKSVAFIEFRFYFSFKAVLEVTLYGVREATPWIPNPFPSSETTYSWWPTNTIIRWGNFVPFNVWWYRM